MNTRTKRPRWGTREQWCETLYDPRQRRRTALMTTFAPRSRFSRLFSTALDLKSAMAGDPAAASGIVLCLGSPPKICVHVDLAMMLLLNVRLRIPGQLSGCHMPQKDASRSRPPRRLGNVMADPPHVVREAA